MLWIVKRLMGQFVDDQNQKAPVCLITGGSSGIGLATARKFAAEGYRIAICGRSMEKMSAARRQILSDQPNQNVTLYACQADLDSVDQARRFAEKTIEQFGQIDVLVNNASRAPLCDFEEISRDEFERTINVSVRSLFYLTQIVWRQMKGQGSGVVVNVSSLSAVDPFPGFSLYGACKAWLDLLTHALAGEGKDHGLRVCSVRPGAVETPLLRGLFPDFPKDQCVQPEEVAEVILGCVNDPESYSSGEAFPVTNQPST